MYLVSFNNIILALNYKVKSSISCRIVCANVLPRHRSRSRDSRGFDDFKNSCFLLFRKSAWSIKSCSHFSRQIKMFEMFQITKNSTFRNSKITFFRSKSMTKYLNFRKNSCFRKYMFNIHSDTQTRNIYYWLKFFKTDILGNFLSITWKFRSENKNLTQIFESCKWIFRHRNRKCNFCMKIPKFWAWVSPICGFFGQRRLADSISYPHSHILTKWIKWKKWRKWEKMEFHVFLFIWSCSFHLAHILFVHFRLKMGLNWLSEMFRIWLNRCAYICQS